MKKSIVTITTAVILMITSINTFAANRIEKSSTVESSRILNAFFDATTLGIVESNTFIFADDFEYKNLANGDKFDKKMYTKFLKANKGLQYNSENSYEILDENAQTCLAKTTMKFKNFSRIDYITLNYNTNGWQVSKVVTSYEQNPV